MAFVDDDLDSFIHSVDPILIPYEFVYAGQIIEDDGSETLLTIDELSDLIENQDDYDVDMSTLKLVIDIPLIKETILYHYTKIMDAIENYNP